jgi:hypothetical protein
MSSVVITRTSCIVCGRCQLGAQLSSAQPPAQSWCFDSMRSNRNCVAACATPSHKCHHIYIAYAMMVSVQRRFMA